MKQRCNQYFVTCTILSSPEYLILRKLKLSGRCLFEIILIILSLSVSKSGASCRRKERPAQAVRLMSASEMNYWRNSIKIRAIFLPSQRESNAGCGSWLVVRKGGFKLRGPMQSPNFFQDNLLFQNLFSFSEFRNRLEEKITLAMLLKNVVLVETSCVVLR